MGKNYKKEDYYNYYYIDRYIDDYEVLHFALANQGLLKNYIKY